MLNPFIFMSGQMAQRGRVADIALQRFRLEIFRGVDRQIEIGTDVRTAGAIHFVAGEAFGDEQRLAARTGSSAGKLRIDAKLRPALGRQIRVRIATT